MEAFTFSFEGIEFTGYYTAIDMDESIHYNVSWDDPDLPGGLPDEWLIVYYRDHKQSPFQWKHPDTMKPRQFIDSVAEGLRNHLADRGVVRGD